MRLLLDTHVLLWTLVDDEKLSAKARKMIDDLNNTIVYSSVSLWEVAIKYDLHPDILDINAQTLQGFLDDAGFMELPVRQRHIISLESLRMKEGAAKHRDPFDRMLIAQAKQEGMKLLTADKKMHSYDEPCIVMV